MPRKTKPKRKTESNNNPKDALRLLYFRCIFGLTQKHASDLLNIPQTSYRAYEAGRHPIPNTLRRKIGSISPVEILPMDPDQDPKDVYAVVRRANPDEFCAELKHRLPGNATFEKEYSGNSQPAQRRFSQGSIEASRKNRGHVRVQRQGLTSLSRLYLEWRDATFFATAILTFLWINCLQLRIPLGIFIDAANVVGLGSLAACSLLFYTVSEEIVAHIKERKNL